MQTNAEMAQGQAGTLSSNNTEAERLIGRNRKINDLRAAVGEFINLFPVPMGSEKTNPTLNEIKDILSKRADDEKDKTFDPDKPVYEQEKLDQLSKALTDIGMKGVDGSMTKNDFDTLKTRLGGLQDEVTGNQSLIASKQSMAVGNINMHQTSNQGLIKTLTSIGMGFARVTGSS
ncbi:hypothetical protein BAU08_20680 [Bordetella bronchialis]|uniref:Uncharacterized protein n=2 Tax=Bordetella bronchialis TaxID=463025 RepID=A0A193G0B0_9BORD|nr:hypothetical protein BAU06_20150 [Bordetella bronchialis]ANN73442.1 hypothetical protein BAU08_20680 [Bordetella bronchialis]